MVASSCTERLFLHCFSKTVPRTRMHNYEKRLVLVSVQWSIETRGIHLLGFYRTSSYNSQ